MKLLDRFQVSAPTRVDLAGGTLDLWPLYCLTGGAVTVNVAIDLKATVQCEVFENEVLKVELEGAGAKALFYEPVFGEALSKLPGVLRFPSFLISQYLSQQTSLPKKHIRFRIQTKAPQGSGLGGSSTLCVAIARALARICNQFHDQGWQWKLLDWVKDAEARFLKVPTGTQDYLAALFGSLHGYRYEVGGIQLESYAPSVFSQLSERTLVVFSGEQHQSGISNFELFKKSIEGDAQILSGLNEIKFVADEVDAAFKQTEINWAKVGNLLDQEWKVRKNVFQVNTPTLDSLISRLHRSGVLGVKVCGAAQGGSILLLVEPSSQATLKQALEKEGINVLNAPLCKAGVTVSEISHQDSD